MALATRLTKQTTAGDRDHACTDEVTRGAAALGHGVVLNTLHRCALIWHASGRVLEDALAAHLGSVMVGGWCVL